jgi:hypothetical protein
MAHPEGLNGKERLPSWSIAERFEAAKSAERGTEDGILVSDDCIAVFDGVSSGSNPTRIEGKTPGQFAVAVGMQALKEAAQFSDERTIVPYVSEALARAIAQHPSDSTPSFVFVAFFPKKNLIIRVGDCSYLMDGVGHNPGLKVDETKGVIRKRILEREGLTEEEILKEDVARPRIQELTKTWQSYFKNNDSDMSLGYAAIDGTPVPDRLIEYIPVPSSVQSIVLASDGYHPSILRDTVQASEEGLARMVEEDPTGRASNSTRNTEPVPDDRAFVKILKGTG